MNRRAFARNALLGLGGAALMQPHSLESAATLSAKTSSSSSESAPSRMDDMEGSPAPSNWNVKLLEEKNVIRGWWYPNALFFRDGTIVCGMSSGDGKSRLTIYSLDGGRSWLKKDVISADSAEYLDTFGNGNFKQLGDGSIIGLMFHSAVQEIEAKLRQQYKPFIGQVRRAKSPRAWIEGNFVDDFARITVPNLVMNYGDDGKLYSAAVDHGIAETVDDNLIMTMYGRFQGDNIPVPYYKWPFRQLRTWICTSQDRGYSWNYLSTVASPEAWRLPEFAEGYCEPGLLLTGKKELLIVTRSGGHPNPRGTTEWYTPLYASRSHDLGVTWTEPKPIYKYGVWPRLLKMNDGTVVCESGRPGVFLLFSGDLGQTWSAPYVITSLHGKYRESPSGYNSIGELEPGVLSVIYDTVETSSSGGFSHVIKLARYRIVKS